MLEIQRYRKKPVEIEAVRFDGTNGPEIAQWAGGDYVDTASEYSSVRVETLEGSMFAAVGDYIIRGVKGEYYPCKPDIFEMTYEPVQ